MATDAKVHAVIYIPIRKPAEPKPDRVEPDKVRVATRKQATETKEAAYAVAQENSGRV